MSSSLVLTVNDTTTTSNKNNMPFSCPLCCEDKPRSSICVLSKCAHESCQDCCVKWIEKAEASGQHSLPGCPWCRVEMTTEETSRILGRPFSPATRTTDSTLREELDDLTRQWLNEHVRQCPSCGASIEKIPGGCDLMECLCGFRFCYGCGSQGAQCTCTPSHHYFWDNVLDRAAQRTPPPQATVDAQGKVDLLRHIQSRLHKEKAQKTKLERQNLRTANSNELHSLDMPTSAAVWLFTSNAAGIRILQQVVQAQRIRTHRARRHYDHAREIQLHHNTALYAAKWLFDCKGTGSKWLQYITSATVELTQRARHRIKLTHQRECSDYYNHHHHNHYQWLFGSGNNNNKNNPQRGLKILAQQVSTEASTMKRLRIARKNEWNRFEGANLAIVNGTWLYQRRKPAQTLQQLARLFRQPTYRRRSTTSNGCPLFLGHNARRMEERMEYDNLLHIRLLYCTTQPQRDEERVLVEQEQKEQATNQQQQQQQQQKASTSVQDGFLFLNGRTTTITSTSIAAANYISSRTSEDDYLLDWQLARWMDS